MSMYHGPHGDGSASPVRDRARDGSPFEEDGLAMSVNHLHAVHHFHGTEAKRCVKDSSGFPVRQRC